VLYLIILAEAPPEKVPPEGSLIASEEPDKSRIAPGVPVPIDTLPFWYINNPEFPALDALKVASTPDVPEPVFSTFNKPEELVKETLEAVRESSVPVVNESELRLSPAPVVNVVQSQT
jgi:hypothetical protein